MILWVVSNIYFVFFPAILGEMIHIDFFFQMGGFNHQLGVIHPSDHGKSGP